MTFLELAEKILREVDRPLTPDEIWAYAVQKGYDIPLNSRGKTPSATMAAQLYVSCKDNPRSPFAKTDTRPKKFYLRSRTAQMDLTRIEQEPTVSAPRKKRFTFLERDLHPLLTYYAYYHLRCYTKTLNHVQSTKKEFGEWVHPDMVGCFFPLEDWNHEVYELSSSIGNVSVRLVSFEIKRELTFANLRESFFQTVSNSSWANEGYLVAAFISDDQDFRDELARLSSSFGIGIIQLNLEDPHSSEIIFPARHRDVLDWETINKLTMNPDFKEFITTVKIDITSKRIHKKEYDPVLDIEALRIGERE